jgi:hypothetical protein
MTSAVVGAADNVGVVILREVNQILNTRARWNQWAAAREGLKMAK